MPYGDETVRLFEIDQPLCGLSYGVGACPAVLGVDSVIKCHNTRFTCPVPDSYDPDITSPSTMLTLRFGMSQDGLSQYGPLITSIEDIKVTAGSVNLASMDRDVSAMGERESLDIEFSDHRHSDHLVDPYRDERTYVPYETGTFWGKWLARNPYFQNYRCRLYTGYMGQAVSEMRCQTFILDEISGPDDKGEVKLTALDMFTRIDREKAVCPPASRGELAAGINDTDTSATLLPAGIGNTDYPASGSCTIGDEEIDFTRSGDVLTLTRGANNSLAEDHDAEDLVQLMKEYAAETAVDILYDLLLNYTSLTEADLPKAAWDITGASLIRVYTARIAKPTPVIELVGELAEQAGFTVWANPITGLIDFAVMRARSSVAEVTNDGWIVEGTFKKKTEPDKRASQVWVYYGQKSAVKDLDEHNNYHSRIVTPDLAAEGDFEYGTPAIREVFSRWIPQFGRTVAEEVSERIIAMFRNPPLEVEFAMHKTRDGAFDLTDYFDLTIDRIQDETGSPSTTTFAAVSMEYGTDEIEVIGQQVEFGELDANDGERVIYIENDANNLNLKTIHDALFAEADGGSPGEVVRCILVEGIVIGSASTATPAITTGTWPAGVQVILEVYGYIAGKGGAGGGGGGARPWSADNGSSGSAGGVALEVLSPLYLAGDGEIAGGGGGGGGGDGCYYAVATYALGGGGGGAGAGLTVSSAGSGGIASNANNNISGASGSANPDKDTAGGGGGGAAYPPVPTNKAGNGGSGGAPGTVGSAGTSENGSAYPATSPGSGGAAGDAISGVADVTYDFYAPTITGPTS